MILYRLDSNNRVRWWEIYLSDKTYTMSWGVDADTAGLPNNTTSQHTESTPEIARTRYNYLVHRKRTEGWTEAIPTTKPDLPMLAQTYQDHLAKGRSFEKFYMQPKLDGIRCLGTNRTMKSRRNTVIRSLPHIKTALKFLDDDTKLDGELWAPTSDLNAIQEIVMRDSPHYAFASVEYRVFDIVDTTLPFRDRYFILVDAISVAMAKYDKFVKETDQLPMLGKQYPAFPIKLVPTVYVDSSTESARSTIEDFHKDSVDVGYEGIIIRNHDGLYQLNYRSPDLLKYKIRKDDEFPIIDVVRGHDGIGIFRCRTPRGLTFDATPKATLGVKRNIFRYREKWIGGNATIQYETLSNIGIPLKPVAVSWRQGEKE